MSYDIGPRIGIEGEKEFKSALTAINSQLKSLNAAMKSTVSASDGMENSEERLSAKGDILQRTMQATRQKVTMLSAEYNKNRQKAEELERELVRVKEEFGENSAEAARAQIAYNRQVTATNRLGAQTTEAAAKLAALDRELQSNNNALEEARRANTAAARAQQEAARAAEEMARAQKQAADAVEKTSHKLQSAAQSMDAVNRAALTAVAAAAGIGAASGKVGMDFEASMSNVQALSGTTGGELETLANAAKEMGATTSRSASEAADALGYMALAGWDNQQMLTGLEPILRLSEAANADLATTSDLVTDSMSALGVKTENLSRYLDIVAKTQSSANTSALGMMEAYIGCGGTMRELGVPLEESAAWIGVLANRGKKAGEAGNSLNSILVNLTGGAGKASEAMEVLGVSAWDSEGKFKGIEGTLREVFNAIEQCTDEERQLFTSAIGGKTQMDTLQALLGGLQEEYSGLKDKITDCDGALLKTAKTMQDNLKGKLTALGSAAEGAGIALYEKFAEPVQGAVETLTGKVSEFTRALSSGELDGTLRVIGAAAGAAGIAIVGFNAALVVKDVANFAKAVRVGGEALTKYAAATRAGALAQGALNLAQALSPIGVLAIAITGVVGGLAIYAAATMDAKSAAEKFNEKQQESIEAIDGQRKARAELEQTAKENLAASDVEISKIGSYIRELDSYTDAQGRVSDAHKTRADFLMDEINRLIPGAVEKLEDEAGAHYNIIDSINDEIVAKRKASLINAMQEGYDAALAERVETYNRLTDAMNSQKTAQNELNNAMQRVSDLQTALANADPNAIGKAIDFEGAKYAYDELEIKLVSASQSVNEWKDALSKSDDVLRDAQINVNEMEKTLSDFDAATMVETSEQLDEAWANFSAHTAGYAKQGAAEIQKATTDTLQTLQRRSQEIGAHRDEMSEAEKARADSELAAYKAHLVEMADAASAGAGTLMAQWVESIQAGEPDVKSAMRLVREGVLTMADAKETMYAQGSDNIQAYANGENSASDFVHAASVAIVEDVLGVFDDAQEQANASGEFVTKGFANGIKSAVDLVSAAGNLIGSTAVTSLQKSIKQGSPSKITLESGMWFDVGFAKGITDNSKKAEDAAAKMSENVLKAANEWVTEQKFYNRMAAADEVEFWEKMKSVAGLKAAQIAEIDKKLYTARGNISKEALAQSKQWIEQEKFYHRMSAQEEVEAWARVVSRKNLLAAEQLSAEKQLYTARQNLLKEQQDAEKKLADEQEKRLKTYESNLQSRINALSGYAGLFDKIETKSDVSGKALLDNLEGQVSAFRSWQADMETLSKKGVTGALLQELHEMGPAAAEEIHALSALTEQELEKYAALFQEKTDLIAAQAQADIPPVTVPVALEFAEPDSKVVARMGMGLVSAFQNAMTGQLPVVMQVGVQTALAVAEGIGAQGEQVAAEAAAIAAQGNEAISAYRDSFRNTGNALMQGVARGVADGRSGVVNAVRLALEAAAQAARDVMGIHSLSTVYAEIGDFMGQGLGAGFVKRMQTVAVQIQDSIPVPETVSPHTSVRRIGEDVVNAIAAAQAGQPRESTIIVPVYLDKKQIAEAIFDPLRQVSKRRGN